MKKDKYVDIKNVKKRMISYKEFLEEKIKKNIWNDHTRDEKNIKDLEVAIARYEDEEKECEHDMKMKPDFYGMMASQILNYGGNAYCTKCTYEKTLKHGEKL